jgi:hypothetical protein
LRIVEFEKIISRARLLRIDKIGAVLPSPGLLRIVKVGAVYFCPSAIARGDCGAFGGRLWPGAVAAVIGATGAARNTTPAAWFALSRLRAALCAVGFGYRDRSIVKIVLPVELGARVALHHDGARLCYRPLVAFHLWLFHW